MKRIGLAANVGDYYNILLYTFTRRDADDDALSFHSVIIVIVMMVVYMAATCIHFSFSFEIIYISKGVSHSRNRTDQMDMTVCALCVNAINAGPFRLL